MSIDAETAGDLRDGSRFVWPPKAGSGSRDDSEQIEASEIVPDGPVGPGQCSVSSVAVPQPSAQMSGALSKVEAAWLGGRGSAIVESGFVPDRLGSYCGRCGGDVGAHEVDADGCASCRGTGLGFEATIRLGRYEEALRESIHDLKYRARWQEGERLGRMLGEAIRERLRAEGGPPAVIVPAPTGILRRLLLNRGLDHTRAIAVAAGREAGVPVRRVLRGPLWRPRQTGLTKTARAANAKLGLSTTGLGRRLRELRSREGADSERPVLIVVDDVTTTGETLRACGVVLRRGARLAAAGTRRTSPHESVAGVRIWAAVVAVAGQHRRKAPVRNDPEQT